MPITFLSRLTAPKFSFIRRPIDRWAYFGRLKKGKIPTPAIMSCTGEQMEQKQNSFELPTHAMRSGRPTKVESSTLVVVQSCSNIVFKALAAHCRAIPILENSAPPPAPAAILLSTKVIPALRRGELEVSAFFAFRSLNSRTLLSCFVVAITFK